VKVELGKIYRTRGGSYAKVVAYNDKAEQTVGQWLGYLLDEQEIPVETCAWHANGEWSLEPQVHDYDLMPPVRPRLIAWLTMGYTEFGRPDPDKHQYVAWYGPEGAPPLLEGAIRAPWLDEPPSEGAEVPPKAEDR
jgi:hypothetical protein